MSVGTGLLDRLQRLFHDCFDAVVKVKMIAGHADRRALSIRPHPATCV